MDLLQKVNIMRDPKQEVERVIEDIKSGKIEPHKSWDLIRRLKEQYVEQINEQSWHSYIGNKFQAVIHAILKGYVKRLKDEDASFEGVEVLTEGQIKRNEILMRKMVVKYGEDFYLLPDVDSVIAWFDLKEPWNSEVLAIVSCKTSLRERIAQACYWKLKLLSSGITKGIHIFLATTDNDDDFIIKDGRERFEGKHRNRVIAEYELDGVYILRENFKLNWESKKVKKFERLFDDLVGILRRKGKA